MTETFFKSPDEFRRWLERNHDKETELLVRFHKKGSGLPSITWPESVDEALCFGWIDGIRKRIDDTSYTIRFTPRKPTSTWSAINIRRVAELQKLGRMTPAGMRAFERRREDRSATYSYEQKENATLSRADEKLFRRNAEAWTFFPHRRRRIAAPSSTGSRPQRKKRRARDASRS